MSEEAKDSLLSGVLEPEELQEQCEKLAAQLTGTIGGLWHPDVVKAVMCNVVAQVIAINVDCLGCANRECFTFDLNVREYIHENWDSLQEKRAQAFAAAGKTPAATHNTTGKLH